MATATGIELIDTIKEELLKSCELTGIWEKKLRDIEHKRYDAGQFVEELKQQIREIVNDVMTDNSNRHVTVTTDEDLKKKKTKKPATEARKPATEASKKTAAPKKTASESPHAASDELIGKPCPLCGQGTIIKGKTAYGCSRWKEGCNWRKSF